MQGSRQPVLVIINGHPATGKTTIALKVSAGLQLPLFSKDAIKERLHEVLAPGDRDGSRMVGRVAYATLWHAAEVLLGSGRSLIIEANFERESSGPWVTGLQRRFGAVVAQVFLHADSAELVRRYEARMAGGERHPAHMDAVTAGEMRERTREPLLPLEVDGETLLVDTTCLEDVDTAGIVEHLRRTCGL